MHVHECVHKSSRLYANVNLLLVGLLARVRAKSLLQCDDRKHIIIMSNDYIMYE